jgi:hypothetical protein
MSGLCNQIRLLPSVSCASRAGLVRRGHSQTAADCFPNGAALLSYTVKLFCDRNRAAEQMTFLSETDFGAIAKVDVDVNLLQLEHCEIHLGHSKTGNLNSNRTSHHLSVVSACR